MYYGTSKYFKRYVDRKPSVTEGQVGCIHEKQKWLNASEIRK
jgi:hypothetical protein